MKPREVMLTAVALCGWIIGLGVMGALSRIAKALEVLAGMSR